MKRTLILLLAICLAWLLTESVFGQNYGVNTLVPLNTLDVAGTLRMRGGSPGAGKVLTTDATGTASWQSRPVPPKIAFRTAGLIDNQALPLTTATWTKVIYNNIPQYNLGWGYQGAAGVFEAPVRGIYHFEVRLDSQELTGEYWMRLMQQRGTGITDISLQHYKNQPGSYTKLSLYDLTISLDFLAEPGDDFWVEIYCNNSGAVISSATRGNWFSGHLVKSL